MPPLQCVKSPGALPELALPPGSGFASSVCFVRACLYRELFQFFTLLPGQRSEAGCIRGQDQPILLCVSASVGIRANRVQVFAGQFALPAGEVREGCWNSIVEVPAIQLATSFGPRWGLLR